MRLAQVAVGPAAIAVTLAVPAVVADELARSHRDPWWLTAIFVAAALGIVATGLLVSLRVRTTRSARCCWPAP